MGKNNDKIFTNKRNLKQIGNPIKPGEKYIHPLTLQIREISKSDKSFIPTEFHFDENNNLVLDTSVDNIDINKMSKEELQMQMVLPRTVYNEAHLLTIYNVKNIDDLNDFINKEINKNSDFETINRIINIFILSKYDNLKNNHTFLIEIYKLLGKTYWDKNNINDNSISKLIQEYLKNNNTESFNFDLGNYIRKNL